MSVPALVMPTDRERDQALRRLHEHRVPVAEVIRVLPPYEVGDPAEVLYLSVDLKPCRALCFDLLDAKPGKRPEISAGW